MNKKKFLIATILSIFLCGMLLASVGAAHAKTVTMKPKMEKTKIKHVGKYTIETTAWKYSGIPYVGVIVSKNDKMLKLKQYKVKVYYKYKGKKRTYTLRGDPEVSVYHKASFPKKAKILKVKVKF